MPDDSTRDPQDPPAPGGRVLRLHADDELDDLVDVPLLDDEELPRIWVGPDLRRVGDESLAALVRRRGVYCRGGRLVVVVRIDDGAPAILPLSIASLRERLSDAAIYLRRSSGDEPPKRQSPPKDIAEALHARGEWPGSPSLRGVVDYPVMVASGRIVAAPGYDHETGLWIADGVRAPDLGDATDPAVVRAAVAELVEPWCDYLWEPESGGVSVGVSALLSVIARPAIDGPVPLHCIDGSTPGTGKGLVVATTGIIATGRAPAIMIHGRDEAEQQKRVLGLLERGRPLAVVDDVKHPLGGGVWDPLLTAWPTYSDRRLGSHAIVDVPAMTVWIATGCNLVIEDHTVRRVVVARIETDRERPEERTDWRYPHLVAHVQANRDRLHAAALTILAGYIAAQRPDQHLPAMGSYEAWSDLVRSAIVWAGLPDPARGREAIRSASPARGALARLLSDDGLPRLIAGTRGVDAPDGTRGVTAAIIRDAIAEKDPDVQVTVDALRELRRIPDGDAHAIGLTLRQLRHRAAGGRRLDRVVARAGLTIWTVHDCEAARDPTPPDREVL